MEHPGDHLSAERALSSLIFECEAMAEDLSRGMPGRVHYRLENVADALEREGFATQADRIRGALPD